MPAEIVAWGPASRGYGVVFVRARIVRDARPQAVFGELGRVGLTASRHVARYARDVATIGEGPDLSAMAAPEVNGVRGYGAQSNIVRRAFGTFV
jgi:hypothetical protein